MSKGHLEALQALRERSLSLHKPSASKPPLIANVTKGMPVTIAPNSVTKPKSKGGRPKIYASDAERQAAFRQRKKK